MQTSTRSSARGGTRSILVLALTLAAAGGGTPAAAGTAHGATPAGSILYVKNHDIYAVTPDGRTTRRITHDGGAATHDRTGGVGYRSPSASSNGTIVVAYRNQRVSPMDTQGYLHVMNRNGAKIRTIHPLQFGTHTVKTQPCFTKTQPRGIANAAVSPDGKHIVYTVLENVIGADCSAGVDFDTVVINTNGTGATLIKRANGDANMLEMGLWVTSTRVLLDNDFVGMQAFYYADLPSHIARTWVQSGDAADSTYGTPVLRGGKLASGGISPNTGEPVVRLWTTSGPPARPSMRCELDSPVQSDWPGSFGWSPSAGGLTYSIGTGGSKAAEGVYVLQVGSTVTSSSCHSPRLLVHGATDSFWAPTNLA
ncbi:MAG TPA: hypothetical protein VIG48_07525 [Jatrophihabitans sp.]|jgi:hypothetical protein